MASGMEQARQELAKLRAGVNSAFAVPQSVPGDMRIGTAQGS